MAKPKLLHGPQATRTRNDQFLVRAFFMPLSAAAGACFSAVCSAASRRVWRVWRARARAEWHGAAPGCGAVSVSARMRRPSCRFTKAFPMLHEGLRARRAILPSLGRGGARTPRWRRAEGSRAMCRRVAARMWKSNSPAHRKGCTGLGRGVGAEGCAYCR